VAARIDWKRLRRRLRKRTTHALCAVPEWVGVRAACAIIPRLPRPRVVALAGRLGRILARVNSRSRRVVEANLDLVYGPPASREERRALVRAVYGHAALVLLDFFWFSRDSRERVLRYVETDAGIDRIIASDEPGIMVTGHMGAWELAGQVICAKGRGLTSVYAPLGGALTRKRMDAMRTANGQVLVPKAGAAVSLLRALRDRQLVGLLLDQYTPVAAGGTFVDFLGRRAAISRLAGTLSTRRGVAVHVLRCRHLGDGRYRAELQGSLPAGHDRDELGVTEWIAGQLGEAVRGAPEQWLWLYRRWRHVPSDADAADYPFYARPFNPACD
jgi:KDO2-lipid IV(A) lauroyltransferase